MATDFEKAAEKAKSAGYTLRLCSEYHWQLLGGLRPVNIHLNAYGNVTCVYVNGMEKGIKGGRASFDKALEIAKEGKIDASVKVKRKNAHTVRRLKKRMYKTQKNCCWCGKPLDPARLSLEHVIPLAEGGSNRRDNLKLCHIECNKADRRAVRPKTEESQPATERAVDSVFADMGAVRT